MMVAAKVNMVLIATSATLVIVEASEYQRHPGDTEPLTMCVPDENVQSFTATLTAWSDEEDEYDRYISTIDEVDGDETVDDASLIAVEWIPGVGLVDRG
jgi:hypothetical protein